MRKTHLLTGSLFLILAGAASAGPVEIITVNTGAMGLNGVNGSIDFTFDQAPGADAATIQILNFTGASYINGSRVDTGSVTGGPVPSTITINAGNPDSDDFEAVTFGNTLTFNVAFSGPAVDSPSGSATGTDEFSFFIYKDEAGTMTANTTDVNGTAGTVTVNEDGTLTPDSVSANFSAQVATPEPSTTGMMFGALAMLAGGLFLRRRKLA